MELVAPILKVRMSINALAFDDAWPEPRRKEEQREASQVTEFFITEVVQRLVRECNVMLHPMATTFSEGEKRSAKHMRGLFRCIRHVEREFKNDGVVHLSFSVYRPLSIPGRSKDFDQTEWFIYKYVVPLRNACSGWADDAAQVKTPYREWLAKVYKQLAQAFEDMTYGTGSFTNLTVEK